MSRRRLHLRLTAVVAVLAVVGGGTAVAVAATSSGGHNYRTALVTRGTVSQTLSLTGTLNPVSQSNADFPVSGTVAAVKVHVGQSVAAGQTLATLQTSSLRQQVTSAEASVASARSTLAADENAQANGTTSSTSGSGTASVTQGSGSAPSPSPSLSTPPAATGGSGPGHPQGGGSGGTKQATTLPAAQRAVTSSQQTADADLRGADTAMKAATKSCGAAPTGPQPTPSGSSSGQNSTASPQPTASSSSTPTASSETGLGTAACLTASQQLLAAQQRVNADQHVLAQAESTLSRLLGAAVAAAQKTTSTARMSGTGTQPTGGGGHVPTAADLAADQAKIDAALAQLTVAQQNLDAATLTAAISGTVVAINVKPGEQVSGNPSTPHLRIIGDRQQQATVNLTETQVQQAKVGQKATVTPDGSTAHLAGHVSAINIYGSTSSTGTTTYPVTIAIDGDSTSTSIGATAAVTIAISNVTNALVVPTSAIHHTGTRTTVAVLQGSTVATKLVTVGVTGSARTQITSGLKVGDTVVLADLSSAVPSSNTNSFLVRRLTGGGGSGLTGGGGIGGGGGGGFQPPAGLAPPGG